MRSMEWAWIPVEIDASMPRNEIQLRYSSGKVHKIINLAMPEDYPGQTYWQQNPNIARAEANWYARQHGQ